MKNRKIVGLILSMVFISSGLTTAQDKELKQKIELPSLRLEQKLDITVLNLAAYIIAGIAYAKSNGKTPEDYGKFIGEIFTPSWKKFKGKGISPFIKGINSYLQGDKNFKMVIINESETQVQAKTTRFGKAAVKYLAETGVTIEEYDRCLSKVWETIANYLRLEYKQQVEENRLLLTVNEKSISFGSSTAQDKKKQRKRKIKLPRLRLKKKLEQTVLNFAAYITASIAYAKSIGKTPEDYGKFIGETFRPSWKKFKGKGISPFIKGIYGNLQGDKKFKMIIINESETQVQAKTTRYGEAAVKDLAETGVTIEEYDRCLGKILETIANYLRLEYKQQVDGKWLVFWVNKKTLTAQSIASIKIVRYTDLDSLDLSLLADKIEHSENPTSSFINLFNRILDYSQNGIPTVIVVFSMLSEDMQKPMLSQIKEGQYSKPYHTEKVRVFLDNVELPISLAMASLPEVDPRITLHIEGDGTGRVPGIAPVINDYAPVEYYHAILPEARISDISHLISTAKRWRITHERLTDFLFQVKKMKLYLEYNLLSQLMRKAILWLQIPTNTLLEFLQYMLEHSTTSHRIIVANRRIDSKDLYKEYYLDIDCFLRGPAFAFKTDANDRILSRPRK